MDNTSKLQTLLAALEALFSAPIVVSTLSYSVAKKAVAEVDMDALQVLLMSHNDILEAISDLTLRSADGVEASAAFNMFERFSEASVSINTLRDVIHAAYMADKSDGFAPVSIRFSHLIRTLAAAATSLRIVSGSLENIGWDYVAPVQEVVDKHDSAAKPVVSTKVRKLSRFVSGLIGRLLSASKPAAWIVNRSGIKRPVHAHGLSGSKVSDTTTCDRVYMSGFGIKAEITTGDFNQKGVRLLPSKIGSDHEKWCVRVAEEIMVRCVPWARLVITPRLEVMGSNVSKDWAVLAGLASQIDGRDTVYAASEFSKSYYQATIHHEIFHIAERHIDQEVYDQIVLEFDPYAEQFAANNMSALILSGLPDHTLISHALPTKDYQCSLTSIGETSWASSRVSTLES